MYFLFRFPQESLHFVEFQRRLRFTDLFYDEGRFPWLSSSTRQEKREKETRY